MDISAFSSLGFTRNETVVYLALVEQGKAAAQIIAKKVKLPRTTVYSVLKTLDARGLIREESLRGTTFFRVDDPATLLHVLERQESQLHEQKNVAKKIIEQLKPLFKSGTFKVPKVEFVEGKSKVERLLNSSLELWRESILQRDSSTWGYQDHTFVEHFGPWLKKAWKVLHVDSGISGRILSNRSSTERGLKGRVPKREVRVLGNDINFQSSIWVMGDFVVLIMTRGTPIYAFQIHEPLLADSLRLIFKFLYLSASSDV